MVIRLSPTLQKRVERAAIAEGVTLSKWLEAAVKERLAVKRKPREEISQARKRLRELAKYKKPVVDFDAEVHAVRAFAWKQYEDNAELIEMASKRYSKSNDDASQ